MVEMGLHLALALVLTTESCVVTVICVPKEYNVLLTGIPKYRDFISTHASLWDRRTHGVSFHQTETKPRRAEPFGVEL
jgi:hypothetical protein